MNRTRRRLEIGGIEFRTKGHAKQFCRDIVARYRDGQTITGRDHEFLAELLKLHPEARAKVGSGVSHFTVATDPVWMKTRHFVIVRTDGSSTDFSYHTCMDGAGQRNDVLAALRNAVAEQITTFKSLAFRQPQFCPYTGIQLTPSNSHVDHCAPATFRALASEWLERQGISVADVRLVPNADNQRACEMADQRQKELWQSFHREHAKLRIISRRANLSHARLM